MAKTKKHTDSDLQTYIVVRKHVNLRDENGVPFSPAVGDEVKLTDHQASRVVNKVRLKDASDGAGGSQAEQKLATELEKAQACVAELEAELEKANARSKELETLTQSQAVELEKAKKPAPAQK